MRLEVNCVMKNKIFENFVGRYFSWIPNGENEITLRLTKGSIDRMVWKEGQKGSQKFSKFNNVMGVS